MAFHNVYKFFHLRVSRRPGEWNSNGCAPLGVAFLETFLLRERRASLLYSGGRDIRIEGKQSWGMCAAKGRSA
jgi:hypothetical protein